MRSIAERLFFTMLAAAEKYQLARVSSVFERRYSGVFMASIAEWLLVAFATCTPEVGFTFFYFDGIWRFLSNNGRRHVWLRVSVIIIR